jgi:hypothetical protein
MAARVSETPAPRAFTSAGGRVFFVTSNQLFVLTTLPD